MTIAKAANLNHLWAGLIVEECIRQGASDFFLSPGSRSAPLACAVANNPKANAHIHFDERSSGFRALGFATATQRPAILITTSGSATANLFPAIIESSKKKVPLIVISADRPPELRFTGANQTIDQVKMFGEYVRWFVDLPTPSKEITPEFILTTIDQAIAKTSGELKGPVHINCMFREPLAPTKDNGSFTSYLKPVAGWLKDSKPFTTYLKPQSVIDSTDIVTIAQNVSSIKKGIIAVGKVSSETAAEIIKLSEKLKWPILADVTSGLRLSNNHQNIIHFFDQVLVSKKALPQLLPDGVIHIGGRITSKRYYEMINQASLKHYITILNHPLRNDPLHNVSLRINAEPSNTLKKLNQSVKTIAESKYLRNWQTNNKNAAGAINQTLKDEKKLNEISISRLISQHIPRHHGLFISSSLPIREMDMFADVNSNLSSINSNRGASGIDGTIASAVGYTQGRGKPTTLIIGDLAFLYDLNSLSMLKDSAQPLTIVVYNNNGGGIFSMLPIANDKKNFNKYFQTPHDLTFDKACEMFDIQYSMPDSIDEFISTYTKAVKSKSSTVIECTTNTKDNNRLQNKISSYLK